MQTNGKIECVRHTAAIEEKTLKHAPKMVITADCERRDRKAIAGGFEAAKCECEWAGMPVPAERDVKNMELTSERERAGNGAKVPESEDLEVAGREAALSERRMAECELFCDWKHEERQATMKDSKVPAQHEAAGNEAKADEWELDVSETEETEREAVVEEIEATQCKVIVDECGTGRIWAVVNKLESIRRKEREKTTREWTGDQCEVAALGAAGCEMAAEEVKTTEREVVKKEVTGGELAMIERELITKDFETAEHKAAGYKVKSAKREMAATKAPQRDAGVTAAAERKAKRAVAKVAKRVLVDCETVSTERVMAEYELKVVKRDTAANTAVECEAARTEVRAAEQGLGGCEMESAERVAAGYEVTEVKAADRGLAGCKMESECEVAGYEVKADKQETVEMESAERDAAAAKAAERDATGNEVKAV
jgi:hypothetical protein